jgi:hypothetical protein
MNATQASARAPWNRHAKVRRQQSRIRVLRVEDSIEQVLHPLEDTYGQPVALHEQAASMQEISHPFDEFETVSLVEVAKRFQSQ